MSPEHALSTPPTNERSGPSSAKPRPYEPPVLIPVGNLHNLLGKSGGRPDATYRRPSSGRP
jgi:hypothetical protein